MSSVRRALPPARSAPRGMQILPPEVAILLVAAYVARALNKLPPYWERLVAGLRFYQPVSDTDIVNALRTAAAEPTPTSLSRGAVQTADVVIGQLVEGRAATITHSFYPMARFPWAQVQYMEAVSSMTMSAVHILLTVGLTTAWQTLRGSAAGAGPYTDLMVAFTLVLFLRGPATLYREMGKTSFKVVASAIAGLLMTFVSLALIHTPSRVVRAIAAAPLRSALRYVASASATAGARLVAQDAAAAHAMLGEDAAAAAGIPAPVEAVVIGDDTLDSEIRLWSIGLSIVVGVVCALLAAGVGSTATLFYEHAISRNRVTPGAASSSRWSVAGAVYFLAPYLAFAGACGWGVGLGAASVAVPRSFVPCEATTGEEVIVGPRDCVLDAATGAVAPAPGLLAQLSSLQFTETGWQMVFGLGVLALVAAQVTAGARYVLQAHLASGKWDQVSLLMDAARIVAGSGEAPPSSTSALAAAPGGGILSAQGMQVVSTQAAIKSKRIAFGIAVAAIYALAAPLVVGGLALLLLRRGGLLAAAFSGASYGGLGPEELVTPGAGLSNSGAEALEASLGAVGASTALAFFHPAVQRAVLGYVLTLVLGFCAVTQSASIFYNNTIWPSLEMSRKDKKETAAAAPAAAPAPAAAAAAPAAAAAAAPAAAAGAGSKKKRN